MALILNIETATKNCSVSLSLNGETLICKEIAEENFSHAERLHVFIEAIVTETTYSLKDLNAVAVSKGPGSYTGLRIGVSSAKGLCYALQIPLIAIDTMLILASRLKDVSGVIIPMIDARRMEVYMAIYDANVNILKSVEAKVIETDVFTEVTEKIHLLGDGIEKLKLVLVSDKYVFHDNDTYPSANEMSKLSFDKYKKSDFVDVAYFEPYYLKDFVMNRN